MISREGYWREKQTVESSEGFCVDDRERGMWLSQTLFVNVPVLYFASHSTPP